MPLLTAALLPTTHYIPFLKLLLPTTNANKLDVHCVHDGFIPASICLLFSLTCRCVTASQNYSQIHLINKEYSLVPRPLRDVITKAWE